MNVIPIRFTDDLYEKLQALAQLLKKPMAEIVREATYEKIGKQPTEIKKRLKYTNPLLELAQKIEKLPKVKYHYPKLTDDELLYDNAR